MKTKRLLLSLVTLLVAAVSWADVAIDETNFPDEKFRNWLKSQSYGSDGVLTDAEIAGVTSISITSRSIKSLQGIEFFTALKMLWCYNNQLTTLDVSKNTALTDLYCYGNQLTALDVSKNTALTSLNCSSNQLTALDVSKNTALTGLWCYENQLTSLDVSKNTALTWLLCSNNQLTSLDVSKNTALTWLYCSGNQIKGTAMDALVESLPTVSSGAMYVIYNENEGNVMTTTQVAAAKAKGWNPQYTTNGWSWQEYAGSEPVTESIAINETNFPDMSFRNYLLKQSYGSDGVLTDTEIAFVRNIDVSGTYSSLGAISSLKGIEFFTALDRLYCNNNQLTALDVSKNTALTILCCDNNQLTALDVSKNTALITLSCYGNQLTALDVSKNTALTYLQCYENQLTALDVSGCTALKTLICHSNQLTALDVSGCTALTSMSCFSNLLTALDVSKNTALTSLSCYSNQLTALDVSKNTALTWLDCYRNQLTALDVSKNTVLTNLNCYNNQLTALDVSKNTALTSLRCHSNKLTALDVSKNTALTSLSCFSNQLTALDVSKNTKLTGLYCDNNQLTALDVSGCTALTWLECDSNQLTALDVSKNTALTGLYCYSNQIKGTAMDALVESLPTVSSASMRVIYNDNEGNVMTTTQVAAAKAKGWTPRYYDGSRWQDYAGSEPEPEPIPIEPLKKCATPTINFADGKLQFTCETEGVEFVSKVTLKNSDEGEYEGASVPLTTAYTVTVYAKKDGYENSDVATKEINLSGTDYGKKGDVNGDGEVGMPDVMYIVNYILNGKFPEE